MLTATAHEDVNTSKPPNFDFLGAFCIANDGQAKLIKHTPKVMTQMFPQDQSSDKFPEVDAASFQWKQFSCVAYKLPNGDLVMSERQMSTAVGKSRHSAKTYIKKHNITDIQVRLPNMQVISVYPWSTVIDYWQYLVHSALIPPHCQCKYFLRELVISFKPSVKKTSGKPCLQSDEMAFPVTLSLEKEASLEVIPLSGSEIRISLKSGLGIIGQTVDWISALALTPRKLNKLQNKGFTGRTIRCKVHTNEGETIVDTLGIRDWLIIWEFFATRGNTKAGEVLRACAEENVAHRIEKVNLAC